MTYEEWGELLKQTGDEEDFQPISIDKLYVGWTAERDKLLSLLREARDALKKALDELAVQTEASGGHLGILTTIFARIDAVLEEKP